VAGGQGDQVHAVQLVAGVAPGVAGGVLHHPDQQQDQPAQLDVGADAVLAVVEHRTQPEAALQVAPAAFDLHQLLVGVDQVLAGQRLVGGAQQPLAVQVGLPGGGAAVDAQQPGLGAAQEPAQPRFGLQRADQLVAEAGGPSVGAVDQALQVGDQRGADCGVPVGLFGVAVRVAVASNTPAAISPSASSRKSIPA